MTGLLWTVIQEIGANEYSLVPLYSIKDRNPLWTANSLASELPSDPVSFLDPLDGSARTGFLRFIGTTQDEAQSEKDRLQSSLRYAQLQNVAPQSGISVEQLSSIIESVVNKQMANVVKKIEALGEKVDVLESIHQFTKDKLATNDDYEIVSCKYPFYIAKNDLKTAILVPGSDGKGFEELYNMVMPSHVNHINKKFNELTKKEQTKVKALVAHYVDAKMNNEKRATQESLNSGVSPRVLRSVNTNAAAPARSRKRKGADQNESSIDNGKKPRNPPEVDPTKPEERIKYILGCFYQYLSNKKKHFLDEEKKRIATPAPAPAPAQPNDQPQAL